jgi:hypothetical protein
VAFKALNRKDPGALETLLLQMQTLRESIPSYEYGSLFDAIRSVEEASAEDMPERFRELLLVMRRHLGDKGHSMAPLLLAGADRDFLAPLRAELERMGYETVLAGSGREVLKTLQDLTEATPDATPLVAVSLAETALACNQAAAALALLRTSYEQVPALDTMEAIVRLEAASSGDGREGYIRHLEHEPSLIAARWIAGESTTSLSVGPACADPLSSPEPLLLCRCGLGDHFWQCPGCQLGQLPPAAVEEL